MFRRYLTIGAAALVGLFVVWRVCFQEPESAGAGAPVVSPSKPPLPDSQPPPAVSAAGPNDHRLLPLVQAKNEQSQHASPEQVSAWLDWKKRSPDALIAAYFLTGDTSHLDALKDYSGNSPLILATLASQLSDPDDRARFATRLIDSDPTNAYGNLLLFAARSHQGRAEEAMQALSEIESLSRMHTYSVESNLLQREAWSFFGNSTLEARLNADFSAVSSPRAGSWFVVDAVRRGLQEIADDDERIEAATDFLRVTRLMRDNPERDTIASLLDAQLAERTVLATLPQDVEYGSTGLTIAERTGQLAEEMREAMELEQEAVRKLFSADPAVVDQYYERVDSLGELRANQWLMDREP